MKVIVKFFYKGMWFYGELDTVKNTVRLPSGKTYTVNQDGNIVIDGQQCKIFEV